MEIGHGPQHGKYTVHKNIGNELYKIDWRMLNINIKTNSNFAKTLPSINLSGTTSTDS